ncbi:MMPL family transporter [Nocardia sp. NPDC004340]
MVLWLLAMMLGAVGASSLHDRLSVGGWISPTAESTRAAETLAQGYLGRGVTSSALVVHDRNRTADDPVFADRVAKVLEFVRNDPRLRTRDAIGYSTLGGQPQAAFLGKDRRTTLTVVGSDLTVDAALKVMPQVQDRIRTTFEADGLDVSVVSTQSVWGEANVQTQTGLVRAEIITAPLILLVLLWLFRGVVASVLAGLVGVTAIVLATGTLGVLSHGLTMSVFVENIATMLGLGVGIDYSLIMLKRFEEELAAGRDVPEAIRVTVARSGHAVVASGLTVIIALASLLLIDLTAISSMAIGGMLVVAFTILSTLLVLPTCMAVLGRRVLAGRIGVLRRATVAPVQQSRWYHFSHAVMRRPVRYLIAGTAVCLVCAIPALSMRLFLPDARVISAGSTPRVGTERIIDEFGAGAPTPIQVVVRTAGPISESPNRDAIVDRLNRIQRLPNVVAVNSPLSVLKFVDGRDPLSLLTDQRRASAPPEVAQIVDYYVARDGHSFVADVITNSRSASDDSVATLRDVRALTRDMPDGVDISVGGETATSIDTNDIIAHGLPGVLVTMLLAIALVLFASFRSYLLPIKAIALNLLSVGATFGILTVLFQFGWGASVMPFAVNGYVVNFVPVLLLAIVLSLNTDYEVFLLTRVRESFLRTRDNAESVATGIARTAPLISGAAVLMIAVFASFGLAGIIPIQQLGVGAAIAIAIDATLVRLVLVPAAMRLMGDWNWRGPFGPREIRRGAESAADTDQMSRQTNLEEEIEHVGK